MKQWRWVSRMMARVSLALAAFVLLPSTPQALVPAAASECQLQSAKGDIQHVIYLIFDNVHFRRDNPNVPSDLEQMPHLLNFIRSNGTLFTNDHTVLISHTANGILTDLTGVYSDRHGQAVEIHATRGPGEADYVQQLKNYDAAFGKFFDRLAAAGINASNTLFVFTVEEGDHFVGAQPTPANCDGVHTPCTYSLVGEVNGNLTGLLATQQGITTPFTVHADMAPTISITGNPSRTAPATRAFGRALGQLTAVNPYTSQTDNVSVALADPVGMQALHMVTADPQRTPTLVMFAHPDYFLFTGAANCTSPCITVPTTPPTSTFAWNHGGIQPEIATTWLGMVGPGVRHLADDDTWADHTDTRPTMLTLVGLQDTYDHDGRVLLDQLDAWAVPQTLRAHRETLRRLGEVYKQLNAPFGQFGMDALALSTQALKSGSANDDSTYTAIENQLSAFTAQRDTLAGQMRSMLEEAAFGAQSIEETQARALIVSAESLLDQVHAAAQP